MGGNGGVHGRDIRKGKEMEEKMRMENDNTRRLKDSESKGRTEIGDWKGGDQKQLTKQKNTEQRT